MIGAVSKWNMANFLGCFSGKFPGARERLKDSPIFPDRMFQKEIRVPILDTSMFQAFAPFFCGEWNYL